MDIPRANTACETCTTVLKSAASLLLSTSGEVLVQLFDAHDQFQLLTNVSSGKCHMCALLHANMHWLSEPFETSQTRGLRVRKYVGECSVSVFLTNERRVDGDFVRFNGQGGLQVAGSNDN